MSFIGQQCAQSMEIVSLPHSVSWRLCPVFVARLWHQRDRFVFSKGLEVFWLGWYRSAMCSEYHNSGQCLGSGDGMGSML